MVTTKKPIFNPRTPILFWKIVLKQIKNRFEDQLPQTTKDSTGWSLTKLRESSIILAEKKPPKTGTAIWLTLRR